MVETKEVFKGTDMFGRAIVGVAGKSGSIILSCPESVRVNDDGEDEYAVLSLTSDSAAKLAGWISESAR